MTPSQLAERLLEVPAQTGNDFVDRLCLQIFAVPALLTYLQDVNLDGTDVELTFLKLPPTGIEGMKNLLGKLPVKVYTYTENGRNFTAFKADISSYQKQT